MVASFSCQQRSWRQGQAKTSFTYLLLDPALIPTHHRQSSFKTFWPHFLRAVFYVGKGKRTRPYSHLYEAVTVWQQRCTNNSPKVRAITAICIQWVIVCVIVTHLPMRLILYGVNIKNQVQSWSNNMIKSTLWLKMIGYNNCLIQLIVYICTLLMQKLFYDNIY